MKLTVREGVITEKEGPHLEFKSAANGLPRSVWETYSAFANSLGGTIVLGVEEVDGVPRIAGVRNADGMRQDILNIASNPTKVNVNLLNEDNVTLFEQDGVTLISMDVPRADRHLRPIYINGSLENGTFFRRGEGDFHCTMSEITSMLRDKVDYPNDVRIVPHTSMDDVDAATLSGYRNIVISSNRNTMYTDFDDKAFLTAIGAFGKEGDEEGLTEAGLLMFGKEWVINRHFPRYFLDYTESESVAHPGWNYRIVTGDGTWMGNLFNFYVRVSERMLMDNRGTSEVSPDGRRVNITEKGLAIREALVNTLVHADYFDTSGIMIRRRPNAISFTNPGIMRIPLYRAVEGGRSDPRNPTLMRMFRLIGAVEEMGLGVYRIMRVWEDLDLVEPSFEECFDPPSVTLTLRDTGPVHIRGDTDAILDLIRENDRMTLDEMGRRLGVSRPTMSNRMSELKEAGVVRRDGGPRGRWVIVGGPNTL